MDQVQLEPIRSDIWRDKGEGRVNDDFQISDLDSRQVVVMNGECFEAEVAFPGKSKNIVAFPLSQAMKSDTNHCVEFYVKQYSRLVALFHK